MTENAAEPLMYCYHCRRAHPRSEMRRLVTRSGTRWRCRTSLANARQARHQRDAFGRETTAANRAEDQRRAAITNLLRALNQSL